MTAPPAQKLGLALSGGGDSTALLLALREAAPEITLYAYIVDHALRPESAAEARTAAHRAEAAGAQPRILTWAAPRTGQGHARAARHRLLAEACRADGAGMLCLGHTLDDRIETLRMRAARGGPEATLCGPGPIDPSPVWPQGRGLILARPFLDFTRAQLRDYLRARGADWIEDPSNTDAVYERVRVRQAPISPGAARQLIDRSDAARRARSAANSAAHALIEDAVSVTAWGGAVLDPAAFEPSDTVAARAFETLVLAVSGRAAPPAPALIEAGLIALRSGDAWTGAGAMLTSDGVLGRDPGAAGRADGRARPPQLDLMQDETGVFDGRWMVTGPAHVEMLGARRPEGVDLGDVPAQLRATLAFDAASGARLAGPDSHGESPDAASARLLLRTRIAARLVAQKAPAWFDEVMARVRTCAALAKPDVRSNIGSGT